MDKEFENFDLLIEQGAHGYRASVIHARFGMAKEATEFTLPFSQEQLSTLFWLSGQSRHMGVADERALRYISGEAMESWYWLQVLQLPPGPEAEAAIAHHRGNGPTGAGAEKRRAVLAEIQHSGNGSRHFPIGICAMPIP